MNSLQHDRKRGKAGGGEGGMEALGETGHACMRGDSLMLIDGLGGHSGGDVVLNVIFVLFFQHRHL